MDQYNDQNRPLEPECYYHIYNRGNQGDNIFFTDGNYDHFLRKYDNYLDGYVETYAFCLLKNHFHFLIRIKTETEIIEKAEQDFPNFKNLENLLAHEIVSRRFRVFFLAYAKSINTQQQRTGSLFQKYFRRKRIENETYFTRLIYYIHTNPEHHNFNRNFRNYTWSSYSRILDETPSKLKKHEVLHWFGGKEHYINFHQQKRDTKEIDHIIIEE